MCAQVSFQHELDVYDFCAPELQRALDGPRAAYKAFQDRRIQQEKEEKNAKGKAAAAAAAAVGGASDSNQGAGAAQQPSSSEQAQPPQQGEGDVAMAEASGSEHAGAETGVCVF